MHRSRSSASCALLVTVSLLLPQSGSDAAENIPLQVKSKIEQCYKESPFVWLSFDDSGKPEDVRSILDILDGKNVRAMFFITGNWATDYPGIMTRIKRNHVLGNHTFSHANLDQVSDRKARWQIRGGTMGNAQPRPLLRPPYEGGAYTVRLYRLARDLGYRLCTWTVDTGDYLGRPASDMIRGVKYGDKYTEPVAAGGVILMHLHGENTIKALPGIINAVRSKGLKFKPLVAPTRTPSPTPTPSPGESLGSTPASAPPTQ